jgi:Zinc carboxypeptidase
MTSLLLLAVLQAVGPSGRPADFLGFEPGADSMLADWRQIGGYMNQLAQQSPFVHVDTLGATTERRPFLLLTITSPANMQRLALIKRGQKVLADPRLLSDELLADLRATQPAVVLISNNIHATEIASSLMGMTLAHLLATDPTLRPLLDSVVVLMIPSMNPDGLDTVVSWYRRYKGTRYEGGPLPWLYHKYVGHDNNRDWFMLTQVETRLVTRMLYKEWFPEIVYDVHQQGTSRERLFVPPFIDPVNPNLDPAIVAGINLVGAQMAAALYDAGLTGIAHQQTYDLWWHGGFRGTPTRHNMIGVLTEAASTRLGSPITVPFDSLRQPSRGVNYAAPWPGGTWRLGDIVRYELIAAQSLVRLAARERVAIIDRFVGLGRRAVEAGLAGGAPFAYVLPTDQRDPESWSTLGNLLTAGGVDVFRAAEAFSAGGQTYPAGSLVVPMAQPFRAHAKDLLEPQVYTPVANRPPYDIAGWTLPYSMGVRADAVNAPFTANLVKVDSVVPTPGRIEGAGEIFVLKNRTNAESRAVAALLTARQAVTLAGDSLIVRGPRARAILSEHAARHGFNVTAVRSAPPGLPGSTRQRLPRIALYQPWTGNMDEGWTRWVFEQYGISYTTVHDNDLRKGGLGQRFDVIVLPDADARSLLNGQDSTRIPVQYAGGMTETGADAISAFVRGGGTLVCLDGSSNFAISRLNLPVVNALGGEASGPEGSRFFAPGSIFGTVLGGVGGGGGPKSPITLGVPDSLKVYFESSAAFTVSAPARALATYPHEPLRSGYARFQERLEGKAALVEAPVGSGRVILFGFRPQFRGQTHGTFKLLFNAVLLAAP